MVLANICPLFKKRCSNIKTHLGEHKLLSDRQNAFRKGHSCETQLITVINHWAKILDNGGQAETFTCILDFQKAFDTPLMNYLHASCMVTILMERLRNG